MKSKDNYLDGSIVRIKLESFLTYDSVECRPGPHLNVIIGPNGTGKSSIVCAICLGLAGKTSVLGRAKEPKDFIKHGYQKALVEIELHNPKGDNIVIRREIDKTNTSKWCVNDRPASQKAVEETVTRLNIQVSNLCQFLPQDKVADFAKMSPTEILENTEKAVDMHNLYENHQTLKTASEKAREMELGITRKKEVLEREIAANARLEQDVKNYQERQHHLKKISVLRMKRPWIEYQEQRDRYTSEKTKKDQLSVDVANARKQNAPLKQQLDRAKTRRQQIDRSMTAKNEDIGRNAKSVSTCMKSIEDISEKIEESKQELEQKKTDENRRQRKIQELRDQLASLENELASFQDEEVKPQLDAVNHEMRETNRVMTKLAQDGEDYKGSIAHIRRQVNASQSQMKELQDVNTIRLENLRRIHRDTYNAVQWLRANGHLFQSTVHEPLMTLINVKDPNFAQYLEMHISMNDMRAFICENDDDVALFLREMKKQNLRVNAVKSPAQDPNTFQPQSSIPKIRQYGFYSYLREMFDCPPRVMGYLCQMYRVHTIPVGSRATKEKVEDVINRCPQFSVFYTEGHQYNIKTSKYSGAKSSRCTELRRPTLLTYNYDSERDQQLRQELQERQEQTGDLEQKYRNLQQQHKEHEKRMEKLRTDKKNLTEKKDRRRLLVQMITAKQQSIARYESEALDLQAEERRVLQTVRQVNNKKCSLLRELQEKTQLCIKLSKERIRLSIQHAMALQEESSIEAELREQSVALSNLEREFEQLKERAKETKEQARRLLEAAKKATGTKPNEELSPELKHAFETCRANSLAEIDEAIHAEQARADCRFQTDESVVEEYKQRKIEIGRLEADIHENERKLEEHTANVTQVKEEWLPPLQELVENINTNFSRFFREMRCAGEVGLRIPENPEDYERYGIVIKVKYRDNEPLKELTASYQSGGEKSVATVLYLMSLQELATSPFRCVDEINQGMDPANERKIFELVVKTACREGTSQYFLLTPKLLPDLSFSERMTVMCVYNAPYIIDHTEWSLKRFLRRRARINTQA